MKLPIWIVDAFCSGPFTGNPAAVCPLEGDWLDDSTLQAIAAQHNLSETAYLLRDGAEWRLRWFTPTTEVDLCGHATLAAAHVIRESLEPGAEQMKFSTRSGLLRVAADSGRLTLDFPARPGERQVAPSVAADLLGVDVVDWVEGASPVNAVAVIEREEDLRGLELDPRRVAALRPSLCVTASSKTADYALRFFAPGYGIAEDPATGAAQAVLVPYWSERLGRERLTGRQLSPRGAEFHCLHAGDRVHIGGAARTYLRGEIEF